MKVIGLTGGIASGKSTVTDYIQRLGYPVVDADVIARKISEKDQEGYRKIVEEFGDGVLLESGEIDRKALSSIIFSDREKRDKLDALIHPIVLRKSLEEFQKYKLVGFKMSFFDVPLLYEAGFDAYCDSVIVIYTDENTQLERLMKRNGFAKEEAAMRIKSQMPLRDKIKKAEAVIDNSGSIQDTYRQIDNLISLLINGGSKRL